MIFKAYISEPEKRSRETKRALGARWRPAAAPVPQTQLPSIPFRSVPFPSLPFLSWSLRSLHHLSLLVLGALGALLFHAAVASAADSRKVPTPEASATPAASTGESGKRPLTKEEEERRAWIAQWCRRAKKDPKCKFYVEKELGKAMRDVTKEDRALGEDEFCNTHKDDPECQARRQIQEAADKKRRMKELMAYCRHNPDAPRCEEAFNEMSEEDAVRPLNETTQKVPR